MTDHRYLAEPARIRVNQKNRHLGRITIYDEYGDEVDHEVPIRWEVCETCGGTGTYVNPDIDSQGLTADDFAEDPDFAEDYMSGMYDVRCRECDGERVVPVPDIDNDIVKEWYRQEEERARDRAAELRMRMMESGERW